MQVHRCSEWVQGAEYVGAGSSPAIGCGRRHSLSSVQNTENCGPHPALCQCGAGPAPRRPRTRYLLHGGPNMPGVDGWTDRRMHGQTDGRMDGWTDGRTDGWTDGRMDGQTDGRMDGSPDGWPDG